MKQTILKGFHRPMQLIPACFKPFGFFITDKTYSLKRRVKFHDNCAYDLKDNDQDDWNKLFGVAFGVKGIHQNSIRFGWRWNIQKQRIELCTLEYRNGIVTRERMFGGDMPLGDTVNLEIKFKMNGYGNILYEFVVNDKTYSESYVDNCDAVSFWGCGFFFGGNRRAPHKMTVEITKL